MPLIAGLQLVALFPYTIGVCARERSMKKAAISTAQTTLASEPRLKK